ncbi:transcriptional regulator ['Osedax' symbiont bacterium Rs2_46_30_T18]|nr:transcriptional regulator ['Osedax' symbiont bacterium Rs2_46_30_T18]
MLRLPPLNTLRSFEAAARTGSFSQAAEELAVTASAVSHQIKSLENYLGAMLFYRKKRKAELTESGEKYLISITHALREIASATEQLKSSSGTDVITISMTPHFLTRWMMPRIGKFQELYPEIELQINASMGLIDFDKSSTDMAIYFGNGDWPEIQVHFLKDIHLVPICSPDIITKNKPLTEPEDIRFHPLIHVSKRRSEWSQWLAMANVKFKERRQGLQLSNSMLTNAAAAERLGIALGDPTLLGPELQAGKLIIPFDLPLNIHRSFFLVYQKDRPLSYGMEVFKKWVMAEMDTKTSQA